MRYLPATASNACGFVLAIASSVRAAPLGCLRPCSHPCSVRTDTPSSAANCALRQPRLPARLDDGRGNDLHLAGLHFPHRLQQVGRQIASGFVGGEFGIAEGFILRGHGESPSVWEPVRLSVFDFA